MLSQITHIFHSLSPGNLGFIEVYTKVSVKGCSLKLMKSYSSSAIKRQIFDLQSM